MSNESLCEQIQKNNPLAYEKLYNNNINLLYSLINRFYFKKEEKEDILSVAKIGLFNAAKSFDPTKGFVFVTYAVPVILGEIKKYFRSSIIHVSRGIKDLYRQIMLTQEQLQIELQRPITLNDIAEKLNLPLEDILFAYESNMTIISLDSPVSNDDEHSLIDLISVDNNDNKLDLSLALEKLTSKERLIVELRYFNGYSQQEVAKRMFTSQVQISRMEKKILEKLKVLI